MFQSCHKLFSEFNCYLKLFSVFNCRPEWNLKVDTSPSEIWTGSFHSSHFFVLLRTSKKENWNKFRKMESIYVVLAHRMPYFSVLGILKYGIGWRPQNVRFENCSIWELLNVRFAKFEKCWIWEMLDLRIVWANLRKSYRIEQAWRWELTKRMGDVGYHLICHLFEAAPPSLACQSFTITGALTFSKKEPFAPELFNLILILYTDHI